MGFRDFVPIKKHGLETRSRLGGTAAKRQDRAHTINTVLTITLPDACCQEEKGSFLNGSTKNFN